MQKFEVTSASELDQLVEKHANSTVILHFTGSKTEKGESWCPDCVEAEPTIQSVVDKYKNRDIVFITIPVGDLKSWKDPKNQYRSHPKYAITCVPTLINVGKNQRLMEGACFGLSLVSMLFEGTLPDAETTKDGVCEGGICRIR